LNVVVDASVAIKWFFRLRDDERDVDAALELLRGVLDDRVRLIQPPHFIAEMGAVLAREMPGPAEAPLKNLLDIEMQLVGGEAVYTAAVGLSVRLQHHLFDTLYQAVALESADGVLVTADERYYRKAKGVGRIVMLADFGPQR
jgi:predicted nucleic acid-binding protein